MNESVENLSKNDIKCKWFYRPFWVWFLILSVGPLALPCLIFSPKFGKTSKIVITALTLLFTIYFLYSGYQVYHLMQNPDELKAMLQKHLTSEQMELINLVMGDSVF